MSTYRLIQSKTARLLSLKAIVFTLSLSGVCLLGFGRGDRCLRAQESWVTDEIIGEIDRISNAPIDRGEVSGIAIAIIDQGEIVYSKGFGLADRDEQLDVTTDTPFQIASMSKPFASASIALLQREGKLSISDPISRYVDGLPESWRSITIEQLLSHTSGVADYTKLDNIRELYQQDIPRDEMLQYLYSQPLEFEPGSAHEYSNSGYTLLGLVVENVSGKSYGDFLKAHIFEPLEMHSAQLEPFRNNDPSRAIGYEATGGGFDAATYNSPSWAFAAGGIVASVIDLAKFDAAIDRETLLTRDELESLWAPQEVGGSPTGFGWGWQLRPGPHGSRIVYHLGGKPGFSSAMARLVEERISIVVLVNTTEGGASQVLDSVGKLVLESRPRR